MHFTPGRLVATLAVLLHCRACTAYSFFFNNTDFVGQTQGLSTPCATAMQAPLSCDPSLLQMMMNDFFGMVGNLTVQDRFCDKTCGNDLASYRTSVVSACKNDPQPLPGFPATYWVDAATSAWTRVCLKDATTGQYCAEMISDIFNGSTTDTDGTELPKQQLCSNCVVSLFRQIQGTPYSNYDYNLAGVWQSIQGTCGLDYPVDVQPLETNVTTPGGYAPPGSGATGCLSGTTYTVVGGDNCETIAQKNSVSTGTLMAINSIFPDCSNLWAGATLCLPMGCSTYVVQSGDTCDSIGAAHGSDFQRLVAWNPAINAFCTNLLADQSICVSPPGGAADYSMIPGTIPTRTADYATATAARPTDAPVATGTTRNCGRYYQVHPFDYCQLVALNQTIALDLFLAINPSIDAACGNLLAGVYYCVQPTQNWNATTTSVIVTPPTATPTGTTPNCYEYYVIQSGDYCGKVQDLFNLSFGQLQYWNPDLKSDCSNLQLGVAYCVNGASQPPAGRSPVTLTGLALEARMTPEPSLEGGVPYGWPGLDSRYLKGGQGKAI